MWRLASCRRGIHHCGLSHFHDLDGEERLDLLGGDTFFGQSVTAPDGTLWLVNETNGLFLPLVQPETQTLLFEEVSWECLHNGTVRGRQTPNLPDMSETVIETGHVISALPVPEHPGWLIEAGSKIHFPMHHPQTGVVLFKPKTSAASGCQRDLMVQEARNIQQRDGGFSGATFLHQKVTADHWGVTLANLEDFFATVEEKLRSGTLQNVGRPYDESKFRSSSVGPNMYQVNEQVIMPVTADPSLPFPGVSWALRSSPAGTPVTHFVTHAWAEGVFEFRHLLMQAWPRKKKHAAAYICFLSNPQNLDIQAMLSSIETSPFYVALQNMPADGYMIMVATENSPSHTRLWCVFEAHMALKQDISLTVVGFPANLAADRSAVVYAFQKERRLCQKKRWLLTRGTVREAD